MANVKITDLTAASLPLAGTELFETVQGGNSRKVAAADIANTFNSTLAVARGGTGATTLTGYVKGNGTSAMTASATIPFNDIGSRAYISAIDTSDQTGSISAATAAKMNSVSISQGITVENNGGGNPTRVTFAAAGTYWVAPSLQFANSDSSDNDVTVWIALNGAAIANSSTSITVPKAADGGNAYFASPFMLSVTAGQYIEVMWLPESALVTLNATAAGAIAPAIPSVIFVGQRIA